MRRLAIITTHPIQYYASLFRLMHQRMNVALKVFYTWEREAASFDVDFGKEVKWDIPLLEGYDYLFVSNNGSARRDFRGVKNPGLIREIEDWKADVLLVYGWNYHSHLKAMRYFNGKIPVFFRGDSTLLNEHPGLKRLARRLFLKWVYAHVDKALYVGTRNKDYFLIHGLREDQLVFAPHSIDNARFSDPENQHAEKARRLRDELGIDGTDTVFLFVGKFQDNKDPILLVNAFKQLNEPKTHLVFVGNGELDGRLREAAGGQGNIHFLPFQNQSAMPAIYRLGQIYCLPSKSETWGLAVNEAMACASPVLVSDHCGCATDLVTPGQNGLIFTSGNQGDLVKSMKRLLDGSVNIRQMGANSLDIIRNWSFKETALAIEGAVAAAT